MSSLQTAPFVNPLPRCLCGCESLRRWGQRAVSRALQTSLQEGDAFHRRRRSRAGEPWQQGDTQTQQPVTPFRNGESTCRQTDVDRRGRHLGPPIGGNSQTSPQAFVSSQLRLHPLHQVSPPSLLSREFLSHHTAFWETPDPSPWATPPADEPGQTGGAVK